MANKKLHDEAEILKLDKDKTPLVSDTLSQDKDVIPVLDEDKILLVTDTFRHVQMFLQSDKQPSYARLSAPGLYSFELPQLGATNTECVTHNVEDNTLTDRWSNSECLLEVDLINAANEEQLGVLQRDAVTGEMFMLLPLEVDVLLQPDPDVNVPDLISEGLSVWAKQSKADFAPANTKNDTDFDATVEVDVAIETEPASQTTLTDTPATAAEPKPKLVATDQVLCERQLCSIVVPKLCLTFDLQLEIEALSKTDTTENQN